MAAAAVGAVLLFTTGCLPEPQTPWVVESVGFHGPRGNGQHYVTCVPRGADPKTDGRFRDVAMPGPEKPGELLDGKPCPDGPVLLESLTP